MIQDHLWPDLQHRLAQHGAKLEKTGFASLTGFAVGDHLAALETFFATATALANGTRATRPAVQPDPRFVAVCKAMLSLPRPRTSPDAKTFAEAHFSPWRIIRDPPNGFLTGYYEPEIAASLVQTPEFCAPVLPRPADLATIDRYPARHEIEARIAPHDPRALVWLADAVEVFLVQVQGSARVRLQDGRLLRLAYAGRNGRPYTSIGRILINDGAISEPDMSLDLLKRWLRAAGVEQGQAGRAIMQCNESYVFFKLDDTLDPAAGPVGAAGVSLTPLRSIAVDRNIWFYGLPFWIDATLPWQGPGASPFRRLMVAQDTGSAILGPARADLFFGWGEEAGVRAGGIRHPAEFTVLLPAGIGERR